LTFFGHRRMLPVRAGRSTGTGRDLCHSENTTKIDDVIAWLNAGVGVKVREFAIASSLDLESHVELEPLALGPVTTLATAGIALLLLVAGRYGYHRDELYFIACAKRLAWGFVDQPPLTPAIARLSQAVAPGSLVALRVIPALIYGSLVGLAALTARELGAGRTGQIGASVCAAAAPGLLLAGHLLSTTTPDLLVWAVVTFLLIRLLRTEDVWLWLPIGLAIGIGLENKWSIGFLVIGLLIGLLLTPQRRFLFTPWFAGGVTLALVLWVPNLWWQYQHDWPQIALFRSIGGSSHDVGSTITWLPYQFLITGPVGAAVWVAGLYRLLRQPEARTYRAIGLAFVVLAVVLAVGAGDKQYYVAGLYVPLWGAGGRPLEGWFARHRTGFARPIAVVGFALTSVLLLPAALPLLPESSLASVKGLNPELAEQVGWPDLVSQVASAWRSIPEPERADAAIFTSNYGEAGAIDRFGPNLGLPEAYSGHNNYWWWGPPPATTRTLVTVGFQDRGYLESMFGTVRRIGTITNPWGIENQERGLPIWIVSDPKLSWEDIWSRSRHYD
jgi:Dolichyl-phosphate-mannose-protein mannosyltransferase